MTEDYAHLAKQVASPKELARTFLREYFDSGVPSVPVNPFQVLRGMGVATASRYYFDYDGYRKS